MKPSFEVKELEAQHVITCRHTGDYTKISEAFERLGKWAESKGLLKGHYLMAALYYDNPMVTPTQELRSDACLVVEGDIEVDGGIGKSTIGGGKFLIGHFRLKMDEYAAAWKAVMDYLTQKGYENRPGTPFELYPDTAQDMKGGPNDSWSVGICLPVK